jgi:beta-lactamase class A
MLGDSGIVYANHGKKYIITILVKRPKNSPAAKLLIQEASKIIFEDIKNLD